MGAVTETSTPAQTGYAPVNGLQMYYEIHGSGGTPLLLLHGGLFDIDQQFGAPLPGLAATRRVIADADHCGRLRRGQARARGQVSAAARRRRQRRLRRCARLPAGVFPGTTHFFGLARTDLVRDVVLTFLDAPMPEAASEGQAS